MSMIYAQQEPKAPKHDTVLSKHGLERIDPYFWMNRRDTKEVLDYIQAENTYTEGYFNRLAGLQESLLKEFERRIDPNEESAPFFLQGREFQVKNSTGKDYQDIYERVNGQQVLFFSENERAKNQSFYELADWSPSPDNKLLAFSEDYLGRRKYTISFRDEKTKKMLKDQIRETDGSLVWANDNKTLFYVKKDPKTLREFQVFRHVLGSDPKKDQLVFEEKDERFSVAISKSITQKYIIITSESSTTTEQLLINANHPELACEIFLPRKSGHLYEVEDHENGFYLTSNDNAPNMKILFYKDWPSKNPQTEEVVPHDPKVLISDKLVLKNYLVLETRINGLEQIQLIDLRTKGKSTIALKEEAYTLKMGYNDEYAADFIYYHYNSMTTPTTVYKYHFSTERSEVLFIKKPIDPSLSPYNY